MNLATPINKSENLLLKIWVLYYKNNYSQILSTSSCYYKQYLVPSVMYFSPIENISSNDSNYEHHNL